MTQKLIIDTNNLLNRIYHIIKVTNNISVPTLDGSTDQLTEDTKIIDELQVPLTQAFFRTLRTYARDFESDEIFAVWDKRQVRDFKNFRKQQVEYKAHRDYSEIRLMHAFDGIIDEMIQSLGIKRMQPRVMEGDDVIAWLAHNLPGRKVIVSVDQDFLQLVNEDVAIYSPIKKVLITSENLAQHTKVNPKSFILYKAIKGDAGDGIPGLDRFGTVRAKKLAENWEEHRGKLTTEQLEIVNRNIQLVDLNVGYRYYPEEVVSYQEQLAAQTGLQPDIKKFRELCAKYNLKELSPQVSSWVEPFRKTNPVADAIRSLSNLSDAIRSVSSRLNIET